MACGGSSLNVYSRAVDEQTDSREQYNTSSLRSTDSSEQIIISAADVEAIENHQKDLKSKIINFGEDDVRVADTRKVIGKLYSKIGMHAEARDMILIAVNTYENCGADEKQVWQCHEILAKCYNKFKDKVREIEHYEKAIHLLQRTREGKAPVEKLAHLHYNLASAYKKGADQNHTTANLQRIREHLEGAKNIMKVLGRDQSETMVLIHLTLGQVYKDLDFKQWAIEELESSISVSKITHPQLKHESKRKSARKTLSTLYEAIGEIAKAEEHKRILSSSTGSSTGTNQVASHNEANTASTLDHGDVPRDKASIHTGGLNFTDDHPHDLDINESLFQVNNVTEPSPPVANFYSCEFSLQSYSTNLQQGNCSEAIADLQKAFESGHVPQDQLAENKIAMGNLCLRIDRHQDAIRALLEGLPLLDDSSEKNKELLLQGNNYLGQAYVKANEPLKAIEHFEKALSLAQDTDTASSEEKRQPQRLTLMHYRIAVVFGELKKYERAEYHLTIARETMKTAKLHEHKFMVMVRTVLGLVYKMHSKPNRAIEELEESIRISETNHPGKNENYRRQKARCALVELYTDKKEYPKIKDHAAHLDKPVNTATNYDRGMSGQANTLDVAQDNYEWSLSSYQKSQTFDIYSNISDLSGLTLSFNSLTLFNDEEVLDHIEVDCAATGSSSEHAEAAIQPVPTQALGMVSAITITARSVRDTSTTDGAGLDGTHFMAPIQAMPSAGNNNIEFPLLSREQQSRFGEEEKQRLEMKPNKQKLKIGEEYMGLAIKNVSEYPEDAVVYSEKAFEVYEMIPSTSPEAEGKVLTKDMLCAIEAYFNNRQYGEASECVSKLEQLKPEDPRDITKMRNLKVNIRTKQRGEEEVEA